jgi:hypothetical protein
MNSICFFSNGHNGDIVHSKTFINDIANQLDIQCLYHHKKNIKITQDLKAITTQIAPSSYYEKFIETKNILFINTWLYPYLFDDSFDTYGVNMKTNYKIYSFICEKINSVFGTDIKLKEIDQYHPFINFDLVEKNLIDDFVKDKSKKILFSNGPCLSGQSPYNEDMSNIINKLAKKYSDIIFIATHKFDIDADNIKFTEDIIKVQGCDLNEIGYLSTFCDLIIGRNSGPFCFCTIDKNFNDPNKIFYAFGHNQTDCFYQGSNIDCNFIFNYADNEYEILNCVDSIIVDNLI